MEMTTVSQDFLSLSLSTGCTDDFCLLFGNAKTKYLVILGSRLLRCFIFTHQRCVELAKGEAGSPGGRCKLSV